MLQIINTCHQHISTSTYQHSVDVVLTKLFMVTQFNDNAAVSENTVLETQIVLSLARLTRVNCVLQYIEEECNAVY